MNINETKSGFRLWEVHPCQEIAATMHILEHTKSGAKLCYLEREDDCKTFAIGFPTIPTDDSGVFHIIEHSVLCGSDKYPIKAPFTEMMKGSLRTFMNAMTYPDKTVYPISTRNDKDFLNLVDTYMDAVLHPLVLKDPRIFMQEGHRAEIRDGALSENGVVFNEMKGAFAAKDEYAAFLSSRHLFPNGTYSFESGGYPDAIEQLTYESFAESYKKYYHPSNAYIFLDGPVPLDDTLKLLDGYLADYVRAEISPEIAIGDDPDVGVFEYSCEADSDEDTEDSNLIVLTKRISSYGEREKNFALSVLSDCLCDSNTAPLKSAMLSSSLMANFHFRPDTSLKCCDFTTEFVDVKDGCERQAIELYEGALQKIIDEGIPDELIRASLNMFEFRLKEADFGREPKGIAYMSAVLESWIYGESPASCFRNDELFASLRRRIGTSYFTDLLREILSPEGRVVVIMHPEEGFAQKRDEQRERRLAQRLALMSEDEKALLEKINMDFDNWQATPDKDEDLLKIPRLSLADLSAEPRKTPTRVTKSRGATLLSHGIETSGITYLDMYFDVSDLAKDHTCTLSLMASVFGDLPTRSCSAAELRGRIKSELGHLYCTLVPIATERGTKLFFCLRASMLDGKREELLKILAEYLTRRFNSRKTIRRRIKQLKNSLRESFSYYSDSVAFVRASARFNDIDLIREKMFGYEYYKWLDKAEEEIGELASSMMALKKRIFTRKRLTLSCTGQEDPRFVDGVLSLLPLLRREDASRQSYAEVELLPMVNEGIVAPATVAGLAAVSNLKYTDDGKYTGAYATLSSLLSLEILENEIRVKGGAYGQGFVTKATSGTLGYFSYCDPSPHKSIDVFKDCGALVRRLLDEGCDLTPYVIGTIGAGEPVGTARTEADKATQLYLCGKTHEDILRSRRETIATNKEELLRLSYNLDRIAEHMCFTVVGPKELISKVKGVDSVLEI